MNKQSDLLSLLRDVPTLLSDSGLLRINGGEQTFRAGHGTTALSAIITAWQELTWSLASRPT